MEFVGEIRNIIILMLVLQCIVFVILAVLDHLTDILYRTFKVEPSEEQHEVIRQVRILVFLGAFFVLLTVSCPWFFLQL